VVSEQLKEAAELSPLASLMPKHTENNGEARNEDDE
jgi:hypothetical protein